MVQLNLVLINPVNGKEETQAVALPESWKELMATGRFAEVIRALKPTTSRMQAQFAVFKLFAQPLAKDIAAAQGAATAAQRAQVSIDDYAAEEIAVALADVLAYVTEEQLPDNPFPELQVAGKTLRGLQQHLINQTGHQWMLSHQNRVTEPDNLLGLMAINYTLPAGFNEDLLPEIEALLKQLPEGVLEGFGLWYAQGEEWWAKNFPELYGSAEEEAPEDERYPRKKKQLTGHELRHLITSLAEDKIGADYDVVRARHRQDLVFHLQHLEEKRRATELAMKDK